MQERGRPRSVAGSSEIDGAGLDARGTDRHPESNIWPSIAASFFYYNPLSTIYVFNDPENCSEPTQTPRLPANLYGSPYKTSVLSLLPRLGWTTVDKQTLRHIHVSLVGTGGRGNGA